MLQRFSAKIRCHSSWVSSPGGTERPLPTLQTRMSSPPSASTASLTTRSASPASATSPATATAAPIALAQACNSSALRALTATRQPSARKASAIARPIPRELPVTSAVLPESSSSMARNPFSRPIAVTAKRARVVAILRTRCLQDVVAAVASIRQGCEHRLKICATSA